jgi:hypothetical protein
VTDQAALRRRCLRVLRMVGVLHERGYQQLRVVPGYSPSGMHWRCSVFPASAVTAHHGAMCAPGDFDLGAHYSSAQDNAYFDWPDATTSTASDLADLFIERFPDITRAGCGADWAYAGWYQLVLGFAKRDYFPVAYDDGPVEKSPRHLPVYGPNGAVPDEKLPLPPLFTAEQAQPGADLFWPAAEVQRLKARWVEPFYLDLGRAASTTGAVRRHVVRATGEAAYWFNEPVARRLYAVRDWRTWMAASFLLLVRRDLKGLEPWIAWRANWSSHGSLLQLLALASRDAVAPLQHQLEWSNQPDAAWAAMSLGGELCAAALQADPLDGDEATMRKHREYGKRLLALADEARAAATVHGLTWTGPPNQNTGSESS